MLKSAYNRNRKVGGTKRMELPNYETYKRIFEHVPRPFAFVDLDLLDKNMMAIAKAAGNKRIRTASKSIRCTAVLGRILRSNPIFQGVMCFSGKEAAFLSSQGFDDLLLGYPIWQPDEISALARLMDEGKTITLMVDCIAHVEHIERIASKLNVKIPLCLDIDMSSNYPGLRFGVWRSPLSSWALARPVVERIERSKFVWLDGMMGYEAQIAGVGDLKPGQTFKNRIVRYLKNRSIRAVAERRAEVARGIEGMGIRLRFVNAGGTGSLASSGQEDAVTELTAGSGFYSPVLFDHYSSFRYLPAAGFAVDIVRQPKPGVFTVLGGGYTASGATGTDKLPQPYLPQGLELFPLEGAGEVQTPLRYRGDFPLAIGDPVFFRHAKAGELCERFPSLYAVADGAIADEFPTYRGMGECFL